MKYTSLMPKKLGEEWTEKRVLELRDVIGVLSPIAEGTDILQASRYPTANLYLPTLQCVLTSLAEGTPVYVRNAASGEATITHRELMPVARVLRERLLQETFPLKFAGCHENAV